MAQITPDERGSGGTPKTSDKNQVLPLLLGGSVLHLSSRRAADVPLATRRRPETLLGHIPGLRHARSVLGRLCLPWCPRCFEIRGSHIDKRAGRVSAAQRGHLPAPRQPSLAAQIPTHTHDRGPSVPAPAPRFPSSLCAGVPETPPSLRDDCVLSGTGRGPEAGPDPEPGNRGAQTLLYCEGPTLPSPGLRHGTEVTDATGQRHEAPWVRGRAGS